LCPHSGGHLRRMVTLDSRQSDRRMSPLCHAQAAMPTRLVASTFR
jgi:hypothetical protein